MRLRLQLRLRLQWGCDCDCDRDEATTATATAMRLRLWWGYDCDAAPCLMPVTDAWRPVRVPERWRRLSWHHLELFGLALFRRRFEVGPLRLAPTNIVDIW